jgi:D-alanine-D-alanine ligase
VDAREIEVAVLEEDPLLVSLPSEVITSPKHEFYSYDAKYLDQEGAHMDLPAHLSEAETRQVQDLAALTFRALECSGLARVDFFLDRRSGKFLFNEVNTLPGFTPISMYPKMMEASGVPYSQLLTRLVEIALAKHEAKHRLKRDFS